MISYDLLWFTMVYYDLLWFTIDGLLSSHVITIFMAVQGTAERSFVAHGTGLLVLTR